MEILNKARQAYKRFNSKPTEAEVARVIEVGSDLKALQEQKGWKHIQDFMDRQREGSDQLLDVELGTLNLMSIPKMFNAFLKYLYIVQERRAYKKINNYVRLTIQNGKKHEERIRKQQEKEAANKPSNGS